MLDFSKFTLIIAGIAILIGLADIFVTIAFTHINRTRNIGIGAAFILLGASIIWLSLEGGALEHVMTDTANNLCGGLLLIFVAGLFVWKAVINIRDSQRQLNKTDLPQFLVWKSKFQTISGIIMIVFIIFALLLFFSQLVK